MARNPARTKHTGEFASKDQKAPVRLATNAALAAYTRSANTITADANGAMAAVDGETPAVGDRILLKDGAAGADNGIWQVTSVGAAGAPFILRRAWDADTNGDVRYGTKVFVQEGDRNGGAVFEVSTNGTITLNTTSTTWSPTRSPALRFDMYTFDVAFGDLGSGASSAEAISGFPTNVYVLGADVEILTEFAGEADLAVTVGDTADADGKMGSVNLNAVAAGTVLGAVGAEQGFMFESDLSTAGLDATFSATELDDVTAGELRVRIHYAQPIATE